jgi:hypothetical protein
MGIEKLVVPVVASVAFAGAMYFTGKAIFHTYHVVTNITGRYASFLGPFVLLAPSHFNSKGNQHRLALGPVLLGVAVSWAALFAIGVVRGA